MSPKPYSHPNWKERSIETRKEFGRVVRATPADYVVMPLAEIVITLKNNISVLLPHLEAEVYKQILSHPNTLWNKWEIDKYEIDEEVVGRIPNSFEIQNEKEYLISNLKKLGLLKEYEFLDVEYYIPRLPDESLAKFNVRGKKAFDMMKYLFYKRIAGDHYPLISAEVPLFPDIIAYENKLHGIEEQMAQSGQRYVKLEKRLGHAMGQIKDGHSESLAATIMLCRRGMRKEDEIAKMLNREFEGIREEYDDLYDLRKEELIKPLLDLIRNEPTMNL